MDFAFFNERYRYDPLTGEILSRRSGKKVGHCQRYVFISVRVAGKPTLFLAHIVAWVLMTGQWPENDIDHRDRDKLNNRWDNLRLSNKMYNTINSTRKRNMDLPRGVVLEGRKYLAKLQHNGIPIRIGRFNTAEEAGAAYRAKAKELWSDWTAHD